MSFDETPASNARLPDLGALAGLHHAVDGVERRFGNHPRGLRYPIASVTKALTALVAARLRVDRKLDWDAPTRWVARDGQTITMSGLLTHTARLPSELEPKHWTPGNSLTSEAVAGLTGRVPTVDVPPLTWHYSNLGYALAANALEEWTGEGFEQLLHHTILGPLGMADTSFSGPGGDGPLLGAGAAAGGLWSTVDDLRVLGDALDGRHQDVVNADMIGYLLERTTWTRTGVELGAGVSVRTDGPHRVLAATGTIRDTTTCVTVWPRRGVSVSIAPVAVGTHEDYVGAALAQWRRPDEHVRTWWLDGQPVDEWRRGDLVELLVDESGWPFPLFSGRMDGGERMVGVNWRGRPITLGRSESTIVGPDFGLSGDSRDSAFDAGAGNG